MTEQVEHWHLKKEVPVALIVAITIQCIGGIWFASKLDSRIGRLEELRADQTVRDDRQDRTMNETLAVLRSDIQELGRKIDRVTERQIDERRGARAP